MSKNVKLEKAISDSEKTMVEISREMGFTRQYLFMIREDPSILSLPQAEDLAKVLNIDFEEVREIHKEAREKKEAEEGEAEAEEVDAEGAE